MSSPPRPGSDRSSTTSAGGFASGKCIEPFRNVQAAHNNATDGSVLFFRTGTYSDPGQINLNKPLTLISTGPALISP